MRYVSKTMVIMFVSILFLTFSGTAFADALYSVVRKDNSYNGTHSYGTNGKNHVPSGGPSIVDAHVSSFYVWQPGGGWNCAEVGWVAGADKPIDEVWWFAAWNDNGQYNKVYVDELDVDGADQVLDYEFTTRVYSGKTWKYYNWTLNQSTQHTMAVDWLGESQASSERFDGGDSNWSHFWDLKTRNSSGTWYSWADQAFEYDDDSGYYGSERSNTEFYVLPN